MIIAEILILSDTGGGRGPASIPEKKEGAEESGSVATRNFFIKELLMNYNVKYGEFPITLSLLTPEFIEPEIEDVNIFYELVENYGFVLYGKDSKGGQFSLSLGVDCSTPSPCLLPCPEARQRP